jgi:hypothetical protein
MASLYPGIFNKGHNVLFSCWTFEPFFLMNSHEFDTKYGVCLKAITASFFSKIVVGSERGNTAVHDHLITVMGGMHISLSQMLFLFCLSYMVSGTVQFSEKKLTLLLGSSPPGFISAPSSATPLKVWVWLFVWCSR